MVAASTRSLLGGSLLWTRQLGDELREVALRHDVASTEADLIAQDDDRSQAPSPERGRSGLQASSRKSVRARCNQIPEISRLPDDDAVHSS